MWSARSRPCRCGISREQRIASALWVLAGPRARAHLREHGLRAADVRAVAGAAGGPKGLVLNPLDRVLLGAWLDGQAQAVHLLGASIGAWRMACACRPDAAAALREMAEDYIEQRYEHEPGRAPAPTHVSGVFSDALLRRFGGREAEVLSHPRRRLHVFTSRGKGLLAQSRSRAHTARLRRRVRRQPAASTCDGHDARARGVLRHARRAAAGACRNTRRIVCR